MRPSDRQLRRRCAAVLDRLDMPRPFSLNAFHERLQALRGRRLVLFPVVHAAPCGVWLAAEEVDFVVYDASTSPLHQLHIVFHEVGHMQLGHRGVPIDGPDWQRLFPHLNPRLIDLVLGRANFTSLEEREAEVFADVACEYAGVNQPAEPAVATFNPRMAGTVGRLRSALERDPGSARA